MGLPTGKQKGPSSSCAQYHQELPGATADEPDVTMLCSVKELVHCLNYRYNLVGKGQSDPGQPVKQSVLLAGDRDRIRPIF
jgi:hypothetical protein